MSKEGFTFGADPDREVSATRATYSDHPDFVQERPQSRQRRLPKGLFIIPADEAPDYDPPGEYPDTARRYLKFLARTGTMSSACKFAGISLTNIYIFRDTFEDFYEEEERAKDAVTDWIESMAIMEAMDSGTMTAAKMKTFLLSARRRHVYGEKQEIKHDVQMSWIDILKGVDKAKKGE